MRQISALFDKISVLQLDDHYSKFYKILLNMRMPIGLLKRFFFCKILSKLDYKEFTECECCVTFTNFLSEISIWT